MKQEYDFPQIPLKFARVQYTAFDYGDYVESALQNRFSLTLTGKIDISEYQARVLAMARAYLAVGVSNPNDRGQWSVLSFRKLTPADPALQTAQTQTGIVLQGDVYRFQLYLHGLVSQHPTNMRQRRVEVRDRVELLIDPLQILRRSDDGLWTVVDVPENG